MEGHGGWMSSFMQNARPYIAMICLQFGYAGMNIITKVSLNRGMSHYVLVVYRHAFATAVIAPFAIIDTFDSNGSNSMFLKRLVQAVTLKRYPAHMSLTSMVVFLGTLQSIAVTFVAEHRASVWSIGWDMNLLAAAYAGIVSSSIAYYVQGLVMKKRGPVFVTAFSPLMMIIVAIMGSFILAEKIYFGGVIGAVLIVAGLYSVLWGKYKEFQEEEVEEIPEPVKLGNGGDGQALPRIEENDVEMQRSGEAPRPS
ncbi:hypothetical protein SAY87_010001 [Trapa incisa]|uniref:WAT1-related protein n=1 Tax=Trapa incisa TaxID=236973 RepID=A0AAN7GKU7_9MYRT|nr:hypothetical protein SAY87_010001 [Trapa incisa]